MKFGDTEFNIDITAKVVIQFVYYKSPDDRWLKELKPFEPHIEAASKSILWSFIRGKSFPRLLVLPGYKNTSRQSQEMAKEVIRKFHKIIMDIETSTGALVLGVQPKDDTPSVTLARMKFGGLQEGVLAIKGFDAVFLEPFELASKT